jgi:hypothetical protein
LLIASQALASLSNSLLSSRLGVSSIRAVRIEAASLLADAARAKLDNDADRAEDRDNLGGFYARQGKADLAEEAYCAVLG